jgi:hypothetical protein
VFTFALSLLTSHGQEAAQQTLTDCQFLNDQATDWRAKSNPDGNL